MAVVIRLQGLPVVAGSVDIRHFFTGLQIPDGGVHIIGGNLGEAFIRFTTDEDARRAMSRTGGLIKNSRIQLFLSSKTEMQNTLGMTHKTNKKPKLPTVSPSGDVRQRAMMKIASQNESEKNNYGSDMNSSGSKHSDSYVQKYNKQKPPPKGSLYVYLEGLPYDVTEDDIKIFFKGLDIADIIFLRTGHKTRFGLVKFASVDDAEAALSFDKSYMTDWPIGVKRSCKNRWIKAGGTVDDKYSKQFKRTRSRSPQNQQLYLHLKNLSYGVEKDDIRRFFGAPEMTDSEIKFLLDKYNHKTREGFIMLKSQKQYEKCLNLHKGNLKGRPVFILPITRKAMLELIESYETQTPPREEVTYEDYPRRELSNLKRCMYVRNFPFDVSKTEVQKFFTGFPLHEDHIVLLFDKKGIGLGEALVRFPSEEQALHAEGLNHQCFLGTEVFLRRISDEQMKEFGAFVDSPNKKPKTRSPSYRPDYVEYQPQEARERSYTLPEHDHREFRGSSERLCGSYSMELGGRDDSLGRYEMKNSHMDYNQSLSPRQNFSEKSRGMIRMLNLPYTVTIAEILDFFRGYNIIQDSIDIKFNRQGMATGHATVCFDNYDEASAAVSELHERYIGKRKIVLNLTRL